MTDEERKTLRHAWRTLGLIFYKYDKHFSFDDAALLVQAAKAAAEVLGPDPELAAPENWPADWREQWRAIE